MSESEGLTTRLNRIESMVRPKKSLLSKLKEEEDNTENELEKINMELIQKVKDEELISHNNIVNVTRVTMRYIELYTPKIANLLLVPMTGSFKLKYCISLLTELFVDIGTDVFGSIIEDQYRQHFKINRDGLDIVTSDKLEKVIKKRKKKFFFI